MLVTFESDGSEIANGFSGVFTFVEERPTTTLAPTPGPDGRKLTMLAYKTIKLMTWQTHLRTKFVKEKPGTEIILKQQNV